MSFKKSQGWTYLGAPFGKASNMDRPVAFSPTPGRIDVFATDKNSGLTFVQTWNEFAKTWSQWQSLNIKFQSTVSIVYQPKSNTYQIFGVGYDYQVWQRTWNLTNYPTFPDLSLLVSSNRDNLVFPPGVYSGPPPSIQNLGGSMYDVTAVASAEGRIDLIGRGTDGHVRYLHFDNGIWWSIALENGVKALAAAGVTSANAAAFVAWVTAAAHAEVGTQEQQAICAGAFLTAAQRAFLGC